MGSGGGGSPTPEREKFKILTEKSVFSQWNFKII